MRYRPKFALVATFYLFEGKDVFYTAHFRKGDVRGFSVEIREQDSPGFDDQGTVILTIHSPVSTREQAAHLVEWALNQRRISEANREVR
jgi:hypothetical protein